MSRNTDLFNLRRRPAAQGALAAPAAPVAFAAPEASAGPAASEASAAPAGPAAGVEPAPPPIPFARPAIGEEEERAVLAVLRSGWLTTGKEAAEFEREFARAVGAGHALAVSSATAGLHLSLEALGVGEGSRVITTPYTFAATAEVIRYLQADPLFVDIEEDTFNLSPPLLERALEENRGRVSAILPVHIAGRPCAMSEILALAARHGVPVVEDAAHAFPVRVGGRFAGTLGTLGVYSFYATKTITTGEGGMVVTGRADLARRVRLMRMHGIDRDVWDRYTSTRASWYYQVVAPGFKYNLPDLAAAIGRVQLRRAGELLEARRRIARRYREGLACLEALRLPDDGDEHAWHLFLVRLRAGELAIDRDRFVEELQRLGIGVSVHFIPLHIMPYYRERYGYRGEDFPAAMRCFRSSFSLPIYPALTDGQVERVIGAVRRVCRDHRRRG